MRRLLITAIVGILAGTTAVSAVVPLDREGVILWLDASDKNTVERSKDGVVTLWRDKSRHNNDAVVTDPNSTPTYLENGINNKPSIRFSGSQFMRIVDLHKNSGDLTLFVVYRRPKELAGTRKWQRLLSGWDGTTKNDTKTPSFFLDTEGKPEALPSTIAFNMYSGVTRDDILIGKNMATGKNHFYGDIAEIIIYDKSFYIDEPIRKVKEYLHKKWKTFEDIQNNWTLRGPMSPVPKRKTDTLPLIDQSNKAKWEPLEFMWDEFNSNALDLKKWQPYSAGWLGREPARFSPDNISVFGGKMAISMVKDPSLKPFQSGKKKYHTYSSGYLRSTEPVLYGYFEIRAKAMKSNGSSSWWFKGSSKSRKGNNKYSLEIDMFEIGGATPGKESSYNMNLHVFRSPTTTGHLSNGNTYKVPYKLADEFHTYGFYWGEDYLRYYIDGTLVRSVKNEHWHAPMAMVFDSETMIDWLGEPKDEHLPSTYSVDYVRAWKNEATRGDWKKLFIHSRGNKPSSKVKKYILKK